MIDYCSAVGNRKSLKVLIVLSLRSKTHNPFRSRLRQNFGFPKVEMPGRNKKKKRVRNWKIPAVFSTEVQQKVDNAEAQMSTSSSFRKCDGSLGTAVFVTGTFGFVAATKVIEMIAMDNLIVPKKFRRTGNGSNLSF